MKPRLIILLVLVGGLAVYLLTRTPTMQTSDLPDNVPPPGETKTEEFVELTKQDLPGSEPTVPPEFDVRVEVDQTKGKNRLRFYITEKHGYFVESMRIKFWYVPTGKSSEDDALTTVPHYVNDYMEAKKTYEGYIEVVPAELSKVGGKIGTSENWRARVFWHHRARMENPAQTLKSPMRQSSDH